MMRPCLGINDDRCPNLVSRPGGRCPQCAARANRARGSTTDRGYGSVWQKRARAAIEEHVRVNGLICFGYGRSAHEVVRTDLVCDHDLGPMCRSCNSRKAATADKIRAHMKDTDINF